MYYKDDDDGVCVPCPDTTYQILALVLIVVGVAGVVAAIWRLSQRPSEWVPARLNKSAMWCRRVVRKALHLVRSAGLQGKVKIAFGFYQVATTLTAVYSLELPDSYTYWTGVFSIFDEIDITGFTVPGGCLVSSFDEGLLLRCILPIALGAVVWLAAVTSVGGLALLRRCRGNGNGPEQNGGAACEVGRAALQATQATLPFLLVLIFVFVPSVSKKIFSTMACVGYQEIYSTKTDLYWLRAVPTPASEPQPQPRSARSLDPSFTSRAVASPRTKPPATLPSHAPALVRKCTSSEGVWRSCALPRAQDLRVQCYTSPEHERAVTLMWIFAAVWPIGAVLACLLVLLPCRRDIFLGRQTALVRATAFLTKDYKPHVRRVPRSNTGSACPQAATPASQGRRERAAPWAHRRLFLPRRSSSGSLSTSADVPFSRVGYS